MFEFAEIEPKFEDLLEYTGGYVDLNVPKDYRPGLVPSFCYLAESRIASGFDNVGHKLQIGKKYRFKRYRIKNVGFSWAECLKFLKAKDSLFVGPQAALFICDELTKQGEKRKLEKIFPHKVEVYFPDEKENLYLEEGKSPKMVRVISHSQEYILQMASFEATCGIDNSVIACYQLPDD